MPGHAKHTMLLVAATAPEYLPAWQKEHGAEPLLDLNMPAGHGAHAPPLFPLKPGVQMHMLMLVLPAADVALAGQALQLDAATCATSDRYLPATQSSHGRDPTVDLYEPLRHGKHGEGGTPV